jgi:glutathione peroxidase
VASKCGFTPQYKALEQLHQTYGYQLVVIGLPCNQFANQEPGDAQEIQQFCQINYGVSFLLGEKLNVKGDDQHPIYQWLTDKNKNGVKNSSVKWNFQKYLLDEHGRFVDYFYSITNPTSEKIINLL